MKIKILQLNLWHGGELIDDVIDFIKQENPDIVFCQEINNGEAAGMPRALSTLKVFSEQFAKFNQTFFPQVEWSKEPKIEQGLATFSRFEIESKEVTFFDNEYGFYPMPTDKIDWSDYPSAIGRSVVKTEAGEINLFNVHGIWGQDGLDSERRLNMSRIIVETVKNSQNVILAGDFNMFPNTESIRNIEKQLHSVFGNELKTTHNLSRKPPSYGRGPVDMIFTSPNIKVLEHYCPQVDISDHLPLVVVLEI